MAIDEHTKTNNLKELANGEEKSFMKQQEVIKIQNTGYIYEEKKPEDYFLGSEQITKPVIFPDGHGWKNHRPTGEKQYNDFGVDGWTCVLHSACNCIEYEMNRRLQTGIIKQDSEEFKFNMDLKFIYVVDGKLQFNANDIVLAIMSGAAGTGTSLTNGAETLRKKGIVGESMYTTWKQAETVKELLQKNLSDDIINRSKRWLEKYDIKHEWLFDSGRVPSAAQRLDILKDNLKYGVIQVAGHAWDTIDTNGLYSYTSASANHAFVYEDYEQIKSIILDTYIKNEDYIKELSLNYLFAQAKQFIIISKFPEIKKKLNEADPKNLPNTDMIKTLKFQTDTRVFLVSNKEDKKLLHIKDEPTWSVFKEMGFISNEPDIILPDTDFPRYDILPQEADTPIKQSTPSVNPFIKALKKLFGL